MAYGKFRNGPTSLGRQAANWAQDDKLTWSSRRRGNVLVRKSGEFTNIYKEPDEGLDGYYSLGQIDGVYKVVGSATARGVFSKRGDAGTGSWAVVPALAFYGKGLGAVPQTEFAGAVPNFDGKAGIEFHINILTTPNGKALKQHISYPFYAGWSQGATLTQFHGGSWLLDGAERKFALGYSGLNITDSGQQQPFFYWEIGDQAGVGAMLTLLNQLAIDPVMSRVGPGNYVALHRFFRPDYTPTTIVNAGNPGYLTTYSRDGGRTWSAGAAGNMFAEFDTFITLMDDTTAHGTVWNTAVAMMTMTLVPLSLTQAFAVCAVPYCEMVGTPLEPVIKLKIKHGVCNTTTGAINATGTLYDGVPAGAPSVQVFGVPDGALMEVIPNDGGSWAVPATTKITTDGLTFTGTATMPFAPYQTGVINAFDKKSLVCPMYDGDHSLYESKDWGATWTKRATIYEGAPAPGTGNFVLQRFGAVTFLRDNNLPTNQTPATPWASDCKYTAPP